MKSIFTPFDRPRFIRISVALGLLVGLLMMKGLHAQMSPEEHASHHAAAPGDAATVPAPGAVPGSAAMPPASAPGAAPAMGEMPPAAGGSMPGGGPSPGGMGPPAGAGGMMGGMGDMMKNMGVPPPKELYPSLMALPELSPELRTKVQEQADERMHAGSVLMGQALDSLNASTQSNDYPAMQDASVRLREGLAQLESGIAARRALAEGHSPREIALTWFKREMNLSLDTMPAAQGPLGVTPFHLFTMALLVAFALAMVAMYFFKMRRAAALFGRIEAGQGPPPPGSAPELAGGKPPGGDKPPAGDKPAADNKLATPADKSATPAERPAADAPSKAP